MNAGVSNRAKLLQAERRVFLRANPPPRGKVVKATRPGTKAFDKQRALDMERKRLRAAKQRAELKRINEAAASKLQELARQRDKISKQKQRVQRERIERTRRAGIISSRKERVKVKIEVKKVLQKVPARKERVKVKIEVKKVLQKVPASEEPAALFRPKGEIRRWYGFTGIN